VVATKRWSDLPQKWQRLIVVGAAVEGVLKIAALRDLKRRPAYRVRGSKRTWAVVVALANSLGVVPLAYFIFGRRRET
jgi:hypothetical protein